MPDLEGIFKVGIAIIFLIIFAGAMAPLFVELNMPNFPSLVIGLAFLFMVFAILIKILEMFGR